MKSLTHPYPCPSAGLEFNKPSRVHVARAQRKARAIATIATLLVSAVFAQSPIISIVAFQGESIEGLAENEILEQWSLDKGINQHGSVLFSGLITRFDERGRKIRAGKGLWSGRSGAIELVMREGQAIPNQNPPLVYTELLSPIRLNDRNQVAFFARIGSSPEASQSTALFVGEPHDLQMVAKDGDPAVGFETLNGTIEFKTEFNLSTRARVELSNTNLFAWSAAVKTSDFERFGIWATDSAGTHLISPISNDFQTGHFPDLAMSPNGTVAFTQKGAADTLFVHSILELKRIAQENQTVADTTDRWRVFSRLTFLNDGSLTFGAQTRAEGSSRNDVAIWRWLNGNFTRIAVSGTTLIPDELRSRSVSLHPISSRSGVVTYQACGESFTRPRPQCEPVILMNDGTQDLIIAYEGMPFPGGDPGDKITLSGVKNLTDITVISNDLGTRVMHLGKKSSDGNLNQGIYRIEDTGYSPIIEAGDMIELTEESKANVTGVHIDASRTTTNPLPALNNNNQLLLTLNTEEFANVLAVVEIQTPSIITVQKKAQEILLQWDGNGILESAPNVAGPWSRSPSQELLQQFSPEQTHHFFRIQREN